MMKTKRRASVKKFQNSLNFLAHGSSTLSKIPQWADYEPFLIKKGKGCRVWDADGNEYIDFRNALGPVTLGYAVPEINRAIADQLKQGIVFGHPHPLEGEVAKLLTQAIPCAEKVRFLKTGGEAIAACIKIARNATKRDKILHCGYNGWLNRLSSSGNAPIGIAAGHSEKGIPKAIQKLHQNLPWAKYEAWEKIFTKEGESVAAVVIASDYAEMEKGRHFLPKLRKLTKKYGALMIMDEIVTGFRLAMGGAHEHFGFLPDLAVFAKGMANGMPLSAYLGRSDLMESCQSISISSTYAGETLSLAAAKAAIQFYRKNHVIKHLWKTGQMLCDGLNDLFKKYGFPASIKGFPICALFSFEGNNGANFREAFFKTCYNNGVSFYNALYVNFSHKERDIQKTLKKVEKAIQESFPAIK